MMEKKVFIQIQATPEERQMLAEIAKIKHTDMSKAVREWIRKTHKRLVA